MEKDKKEWSKPEIMALNIKKDTFAGTVSKNEVNQPGNPNYTKKP